MENLPSEVLFSIFDCLELRDRIACRLSCRRFNKIVGKIDRRGMIYELRRVFPGRLVLWVRDMSEKEYYYSEGPVKKFFSSNSSMNAECFKDERSPLPIEEDTVLGPLERDMLTFQELTYARHLFIENINVTNRFLKQMFELTKHDKVQQLRIVSSVTTLPDDKQLLKFIRKSPLDNVTFVFGECRPSTCPFLTSDLLRELAKLKRASITILDNNTSSCVVDDELLFELLTGPHHEFIHIHTKLVGMTVDGIMAVLKEMRAVDRVPVGFSIEMGVDRVYAENLLNEILNNCSAIRVIHFEGNEILNVTVTVDNDFVECKIEGDKLYLTIVHLDRPSLNDFSLTKFIDFYIK